MKQEDKMNTLQEVLEVWLNNREFREKFKINPELALENEHLQLNPDDLKKIKAYINLQNDDSSGEDNSLDKRINR